MPFSSNSKIINKYLLIGITLIAIATASVHRLLQDANSPALVQSTISRHKVLFKNKYVLQEYLFWLGLYKSLDGAISGDLPKELDDYLMTLLNHDPNLEIKKDVIDFYVAAAYYFNDCCESLAKHPNQELIGNIIEQSKSLDGNRKLYAMRLIESMRTHQNLASSKTDLSPIGWKAQRHDYDQIQDAFNLYEKWWNAPIPLPDKLKINPLESTSYRWRSVYR